MIPRVLLRQRSTFSRGEIAREVEGRTKKLLRSPDSSVGAQPPLTLVINEFEDCFGLGQCVGGGSVSRCLRGSRRRRRGIACGSPAYQNGTTGPLPLHLFP